MNARIKNILSGFGAGCLITFAALWIAASGSGESVFSILNVQPALGLFFALPVITAFFAGFRLFREKGTAPGNESGPTTRELEKSQRFLDSVIDNIPMVVFVKDAESGKYIKVNRAYEELFRKRRSDMQGRTDDEIFPPELAEEYKATDRETFARKTVLDISSEIIPTPHMGKRILFTKKVPVLDSSGNPIYLLGISQDITEVKKAEKKNKKYLRELEKSNKELDEFAYVVSHDLKSPLRGINNLLEWILEDFEEGNFKSINQNVHLIRTRIHRLESFIEGLLEYSRIGRESLDQEIFRVREVMTDAVESLDVPGSVAIEYSGSDAQIRGQKHRFVQVITNLVENAFKYSDKENTRISVRWRQDENFLIFVVDDNGPGIDEKNREKVFEMFHRLHSQEDVEGAGIGLPIVKKIVEDQGGKIKISESSQLGGTSIEFSWPLNLSELRKSHPEKVAI